MKKIKDLFIKYQEIISYLIFGVLTTVISLATYYLLVYTILDPNKGFELQIANIISWIAAVTFAYFTNRKYVFKSNKEKRLKEAFNFYLSRLSTLLIDMFLMWLLVTKLSFNDKVIKMIVQIVVIVLNYVFSKFLVFEIIPLLLVIFVINILLL